jgi:hypothetical protein
MANALDLPKIGITKLENDVDIVNRSVYNEFREKYIETEHTYK